MGFGRGGGLLLWHVLYELIFVSGVRVSLTSGKGYVATGFCPNFSKASIYLWPSRLLRVGQDLTRGGGGGFTIIFI